MSAFSCGFVTFVLPCLGQIDHSVVFSSVITWVAADKTFVAVTTVGAAFCGWRLVIKALVFVYLIRQGCGYLFHQCIWIILSSFDILLFNQKNKNKNSHRIK